MLEVEIQNFQSISREVIKIEGFTALVGRSNIGKSAVVRAINAALTGAPVDASVRHDPSSCARHLKGTQKCKCSCIVRITSPDFKLEWEKGDAVNRYNYQKGDGEAQEYTVVGRGTPEFLQPEFLPVEVGGSKSLIQVSGQWHPIFLLDQTGVVIADVLSDVARLDDINKAISLVERDRKEAASTRKLREKDAAQLKGKLSLFEGLDDVLAQVRAVEDQEKEVDSARHKAEELTHFQASVWTLARQVRSLEQVQSIEVMDGAPLRECASKYKVLNRFADAVGARQQAVSALDGVGDIELPNATPFINQVAEVNKLGRWLEKFRYFKQVLGHLQGVTAVEPPEAHRLKAVSGRWADASQFQDRLLRCAASIKALEGSISEVEVELEALQSEASKLGVCPTCRQPVLEGHAHLEGV